MDKMAREKEDMIERAKNGYLEKEKAFQESNQDLQSKLEDAQIRERQLTWNLQDLTKEKEMQIEKYIFLFLYNHHFMHSDISFVILKYEGKKEC